MNLKSIGLTFATGIAIFLIVSVVVTELVQPWIEFSLLVGIPVGLVAGALAAVLVAIGLGDNTSVQRRWLALSFGGFAAGFLVVLGVGGVANLGVWLSIVAGVVVGVLTAIGLYVRRPKSPRSDTSV